MYSMEAVCLKKQMNCLVQIYHKLKLDQAACLHLVLSHLIKAGPRCDLGGDYKRRIALFTCQGCLQPGKNKNW